MCRFQLSNRFYNVRCKVYHANRCFNYWCELMEACAMPHSSQQQWHCVIMWIKGHRLYSHTILFLLCMRTQRGPVSGTGARLLGGLSPLYKQDRKEGVSSGVLFCPPPLHWGQMLWKWSSNRALGMTEWCRELDLQNLMTFDSCINRKQKVQLSVLFTWKRIQGGRAWWCKCFASIK